MSSSPASTHIPECSALTNFVQQYRLPSLNDMKLVAGMGIAEDLEIGTLVRLHSRPGSKFKFTGDITPLFKHLSYIGPISP